MRKKLWWEQQRKAKCGWLVKTDLGDKTQKLEREITDILEYTSPHIGYRWLDAVTVLGNEGWDFWLLVLTFKVFLKD